MNYLKIKAFSIQVFSFNNVIVIKHIRKQEETLNC
jgi:hypothetical protein